MSGILRLESLTKGNTLKQGDKTPLKYRLFDADGEKLNIAGKSAVARLMYPDFLRAGYESEELTVSPDNTVTFSIDKVIQPILYYLEITVDDKYIFPSRDDESKLNIDKSSKGSDVAIIEIVGKDVLVRDIKNMVDSEIEPVVNDMIISNQKVIENEKIVKDVQTLSEQLETRQNQVEQFNNQVITEMTNKDVISAPEIIDARGGHDTLGGRLDDTTSQLAHKANKQLRIVNVDDYSTAGEKDDTSAILNAVASFGGSGGVVVFSPRKYLCNSVTFTDIKDVKFVGNHSTIVYNGLKDVTIQGTNNSHIFKFENGTNIVLEDLYFEGKMFDGLDKDNLPTSPVTGSEFTTSQHRGVYLLNCENITLNNCHAYDINTGFRIFGCNIVNLNRCTTRDIVSGFSFTDTENIRGNFCITYDARFRLDEVESGSSGPSVDTIGSGGTGFLFVNSKGLLENSDSHRSATNTFRIQATSVIEFTNCKSYQARRHGFSIYGDGSTGTFNNCHAYNTADPTFWNGKDNVDTFKRPHSVDAPTSFIVTDTNNIGRFKKCTAKSKLYEDVVVPVTSNIGGVFQAVAEGAIFRVVRNSAKHIEVEDCNFEGYTTATPFQSDNDNVRIVRTKLMARVMTDDSLIYAMTLIGNNIYVLDNEIENGRDGVVGTGNMHVYRGNIIKNSYRTGLSINASNSLVDNNMIINVSQGTDGNGIQVTRGNITLGTNVVIDDRATPTTLYALRIESGALSLHPGTLIVRGEFAKVSRVPTIDQDAMPIYGKATTQADSVSTDVEGLKTDLNVLLSKLKNSGLMA